MNEYLTTRELAELLRIKERKVYDLASSGSVPCSRATGKLLFPREAINNWITEHASGVETTQALVRPNVILGSHDPLLEWAIRESRCGLATYFDSSLDGLERFANHEGVASGLHIYHDNTGNWNTNEIKSRFNHQPVVLVAWAKRQRGIIMSQDKSFQGLADLPGQTVIPRQAEAGSQLLLTTLLHRNEIDINKIHRLPPARSEVDAVLAVQEGKADAAFGLASLAAQYQLEFVPVIEERFDILVDRRAWFEPGWQSLIKFCRTEAFRQRSSELAGNRLDDLFEVCFNAEQTG